MSALPEGWWFADRSRWYARFGRDVVEHFESKLAYEPNSGCHLWTRGVDKDGYPKMQLCIAPEMKQVHVRAHRFFWALHHGRWPRMHLLHSCDTPACCNALHAREGTQAENIADKVARGRCAVGERSGAYTHPERRPRGTGHGCASIDETIAQRVVTLLKFGLRPCDVARKVPEAPKTIVYSIAQGRTWRHLSGFGGAA